MQRLVSSIVLHSLISGSILLLFAPVDASLAGNNTSLLRRLLPGKQKSKSPHEQLALAHRLRDEHHRSALKAYRKIVKTWPESPEAPFAQFAYARLLQEKGQLRKAFDEFQVLIEQFAGRFPQYDDVLQHQFEIAREVMEKRSGEFLIFDGFVAPERAIPLLEKIVQNGPQWKFAPEAQYLIGQAQEHIQEYEQAMEAYLVCQSRYPASPFAEKSSYRRAVCLYQLAKENPYSKDLLEQSWTALSLFLQAYPESEYGSIVEEYRSILYQQRARASYDVAVFYDTVVKKPRAALLAYREFVGKFPDSDWTKLAQMRVDALTLVVEKNK